MSPILSQRSPSTIVTCIMHTCIIRLMLQANGLQAMHTLWSKSHMFNKPYTLQKHCGGVVTKSAQPTHCTMHVYSHAKEGLRYRGPL